jgi:protein-ribulosamine 3-kinase
MSVAKKIIHDIEVKLDDSISKVIPVSGGSINKVYRLQTSSTNSFLLKLNSLYEYPGMFKLEQEGLAAIQSTQTIAVPNVLLCGETEAESYLVIQWIEPGQNTRKSSQKLGEQLAQMHQYTSSRFGFPIDNYMGSLIQSNKLHTTWDGFFIEERLKPMIKIAYEKHALGGNDIQLFEKLFQKLPELFDEEPPALVHGDLWSGNYLIDTNEVPYLIDPAVSYSNREFDIAMTTLFGGFDTSFYEAYHSNFQLQTGWKQRLNLWNLYPLLLHVNLFGDSYITQVRYNLSMFV